MKKHGVLGTYSGVVVCLIPPDAFDFFIFFIFVFAGREMNH